MLRFGLAGVRINTRDGGERVVRFIDITPERAEQLLEPWWNEPGIDQTAADDEDDREWDWVDFAVQSVDGQLPDCIGLETADDGQVQGAMWLDKSDTSQLEPGKLALHVQRVASAPRNRKDVVTEPRHSSVGKALLLYAVHYSYALGHEGRIILTALPDAEPIYEHLGSSGQAVAMMRICQNLNCRPQQARVCFKDIDTFRILWAKM